MSSVKSSQQLEPSEIRVLGEELGEGDALAQSQKGNQMRKTHYAQVAPYSAFDTEDEQNLQVWAEAARLLLAEVALEGKVITYKEMWDALLARDVGPAPQGLWRRRIGTLLCRVAQLNRINDEPLLAALAVRKSTGEVSGGYEDGVQARYGYTPHSITHHARMERFKIARWLGV